MRCGTGLVSKKLTGAVVFLKFLKNFMSPNSPEVIPVLAKNEPLTRTHIP
jgi:hypothetical protein